MESKQQLGPMSLVGLFWSKQGVTTLGLGVEYLFTCITTQVFKRTYFSYFQSFYLIISLYFLWLFFRVFTGFYFLISVLFHWLIQRWLLAVYCCLSDKLSDKKLAAHFQRLPMIFFIINYTYRDARQNIQSTKKKLKKGIHTTANL